MKTILYRFDRANLLFSISVDDSLCVWSEIPSRKGEVAFGSAVTIGDLNVGHFVQDGELFVAIGERGFLWDASSCTCINEIVNETARRFEVRRGGVQICNFEYPRTARINGMFNNWGPDKVDDEDHLLDLAEMLNSSERQHRYIEMMKTGNSLKA